MRKEMLIGAGLILGTALLVWAGNARAEETTRIAGLLCKSQEGVKSFLAIHESNGQIPLPSALEKINDTMGEDTCIFGVVMGQEKEILDNVPFDGHTADIIRVEVWAECMGGFCIWAKQPDVFVGKLHDAGI